MVYMNPNGFDLSPNPNLDGWGISHVVVGTLYTLVLWAVCYYVWVNREHPMLRMRNVPLMLLAINCLHLYLYILFVIYAMNGAFSCQWEFWWMSIYLPIGIGLFQAQNQQLLLVSRQQAELMVRDDMYKPLPCRPKGSIGGPKYYVYRLKIWWRDVNQQRKYEAYMLIGMIFQVRFITMICPVSSDRWLVSRNSSSLHWVSTVPSLWSVGTSCVPSEVPPRLGMVRYTEMGMKRLLLISS